jgi:hypothetical protein
MNIKSGSWKVIFVIGLFVLVQFTGLMVNALVTRETRRAGIVQTHRITVNHAGGRNKKCRLTFRKNSR